MFIVYLHKQVFLYRASLVPSESSCRPDGEVFRSIPKRGSDGTRFGGSPDVRLADLPMTTGSTYIGNNGEINFCPG